MPFCEMGERVLVTGFVGWGVGDKKAWIKFFICFDDALQVKPHDFEGFKPVQGVVGVDAAKQTGFATPQRHSAGCVGQVATELIDSR